MSRSTVLWLALSVATVGCVRPAVSPPMDAVARDDAVRELAALRSRFVPLGARGFRVAATLREARSGKTIAARGAIAVRPPGDVRMQLVGPAGALALDVWIAGARHRLAVPALDRVERSGDPDTGAGRPVAFLRWWMLHPLDGDLRDVARVAGGTRYTLAVDDGAIVDATVTDGGRTISLVRRSPRDEETVLAHDAPCGDATYESRASGVRVELRCEGEAAPPSSGAFEDPDVAQ